MSAPALASIKVGDEIEPLSRTVPQEQIDAYAEASGDHNPIHVDPDFAQSVGLPGAIAHGLLSLGILTQAIARWAGGAENVASLEVRFSKPLVAGGAITCTGRVVAVDDTEGTATLEVGAASDSGEQVLTNGRSVVRLRRAPDTANDA